MLTVRNEILSPSCLMEQIISAGYELTSSLSLNPFRIHLNASLVGLPPLDKLKFTYLALKNIPL